MTLAGKLKEALHIGNKDSAATTGETGGAGHATGHATEPQTGAEAYQPMTKNAEGGTHGTTAGSAKNLTGSHTDGSSQTAAGTEGAHGHHGQTSGVSGTHGSSGMQGSGVSGKDGVVSGSSSTTGATGTTGGQPFNQGYKEGEPGYSSTYKHPDPLYKESIQRGDDGSYSADLKAEADNKHWAQARELTLAAEREVAAAKLSGNKASKELAAAEKAEEAVRMAQIKHREALEEAEKYRHIMSDSNLKEQDLSDAQNLYNARRNAASQAESDLRSAEGDLAHKKRELEGLTPHLDKHGQVLPGLEDELAARQRDRAAAEGERDQALGVAQEYEANRRKHAAELEGLESQVDALERTAAVKQQEYIDARNAAQNAAQRAADLKSRLRGLDDELLGARNRAQEADQNLPAYKEAEARAARELENAQAEWYRLKEMEDEYGRNYTAAHDRYKGLHGKHGPASKELQDSHSLLKAREDDLARARDRSASAEKKYRELLGLADRHKKYGDSAAQAAQAHGQKYEALKQEAAIHGDKHVEYWNAARSHGETGSTESSNLIHKLEERVKEMTHKNEP